tara:strand:- start:591 stop:998 length:408 start_codon:yes stop_codon:yes gene_type:complete
MINKQSGTLYEQLFIAEAMKRGLHVSEVKGDYLPYDVVIDNGKKLIKVQVKGTRCKQGTSGYKITVGKGNSLAKKTVRDANSFDILAAVVVADGARHWYLIPEDKFPKVITLRLAPSPTSKGKYEVYKHGWDLIC